MSEQSAFRFTRKSSANSVLRRLKVYVAGQFVLAIKDGETVDTPTSPGKHEITVWIDWGSSQPFEVSLASGDKVALICAPNNDYFSSLFRMVTSAGTYWNIERA